MCVCVHIYSLKYARFNCTLSMSEVLEYRGRKGMMWGSKMSGPVRNTIKHQWQEQMVVFIVPRNANTEYLYLVGGIIIYLFSPSCPANSTGGWHLLIIKTKRPSKGLETSVSLRCNGQRRRKKCVQEKLREPHAKRDLTTQNPGFCLTLLLPDVSCLFFSKTTTPSK